MAIGLLLGAFTVCASHSAIASKPVARAIVGCVTDARLTSDDGYEITVVSEAMARIDLSRWNGLKIRFDGLLLPQDRLIVKSDPVVLGSCQAKPPGPDERKGKP